MATIERRRCRYLGLTSAIILVGLLGGCGGSGQSASGGAGVAIPGPGGQIFGGGAKNPISGSIMTLYAMATTGYGVTASTLATTTSNSGGGFSFTSSYTCPSPNLQTYITGTGGNPGSGNNSAVGMMALTGLCGSLSASTFVIVNELTTAAAEWALAQFSDSNGVNFGTSATNAIGLNNAVRAAENNLVVSYLGSGGTPSNVGIPASFLPTAAQCSSGSPPVNCDGLERLDTLANILAACINSSGPSSTACSTLFSATGVRSSLTMLAVAHAIVTNPTSNASTIYVVQGTPATAPFQPPLATAPSDFTLALNFAPESASFSAPQALALDSSGDVFVANCGSVCGGSGNASVSELTATSSYGTGSNFAPSGAPINNPFALALDSSGNVFVANLNSNSVSELTAASNYGTGSNFAPPGRGLQCTASAGAGQFG